MYQEVDARFEKLEQERQLGQKLQRWPKSAHLNRMRDSGYFRFTRELFLHHTEQGDAPRFIDMILTNAYGYHFKQNNITEQEIGFDRFKHAAFQHIGSEPIPWYFSYRVRIGIK